MICNLFFKLRELVNKGTFGCWRNRLTMVVLGRDLGKYLRWLFFIFKNKLVNLIFFKVF